ncbi:hypothetical protein COO60DRAFT_1526227, partial [Scenedesmus sp. NREL 46B-D3]
MLKQHKLGTHSSHSTSSTPTATGHTSFSNPPAGCRSLRGRDAVQWRGLTASVTSAATGICSHGGVSPVCDFRAAVPLRLRRVEWMCVRGVSTNASSEPGSAIKHIDGNEQQASSGYGSNTSNTGGNRDPSIGTSSSGGNGGSGGGPRQPWTSSSGGQPGDSNSSSWLPAWLRSDTAELALSVAALAMAALFVKSAAEHGDRAKQAAAAAPAAAQGEQKEQGAEGSSGLSASMSISTMKRLLREVFADHLGFKARLDSLEQAAAAEAEAADDFELRTATGSRASFWSRAPVRATGWFSAAGVLPWTGEARGSDTLGMLHALGAAGQADGRVALHSVLAGGKRRVTAELAPASQMGGQAMLQLQKLLYRVQIGKSLQLLIAPLGGGVDAIGRAITPIQADYGCTTALRQGHGLSVLDRLGSGKAASVSRGRLSATAGFFVGGSGKTSLAKLQLNGLEGHSLAVVAARCRPCKAAAAADAAEEGSSSSGQQGLRFLGVQAPGSSSSSSSSAGSCETAGTVLGVAGEQGGAVQLCSVNKLRSGLAGPMGGWHLSGSHLLLGVRLGG